MTVYLHIFNKESTDGISFIAITGVDAERLLDTAKRNGWKIEEYGDCQHVTINAA